MESNHYVNHLSLKSSTTLINTNFFNILNFIKNENIKYNLEHRRGFEPPMSFRIRICNPSRSAISLPMHKLLNNLNKKPLLQNLAGQQGLEPWPTVFLNTLFRKHLGDWYAAITLLTCKFIWDGGEIWTHGFTVLQTVPLDRSGTPSQINLIKKALFLTVLLKIHLINLNLIKLL